MLEVQPVSESSDHPHSPSDTAWAVVLAIAGVVTAIVGLPLANALLALGVVGILWAVLLRARPLELRWRSYLLGLSMVLCLVGGVWLIVSAGDGASSTAGTPSVNPPAHPRPAPPPSQSGIVPLAMTRSGSATITLPPGNEVPRCWKYDGDARLRAGRTLLVAARRVYPPDRWTYFAPVTWTGEVGQSTWSAARWFGTVDYQTYRVFVLAITTSGLKDILTAHGFDPGGWRDTKLPPRKITEVVRLPDVRQIPGPDNCDA